MIYIKRKSLLDTTADIIICPVSKDGIVGNGLIKDIFYKYPDIYPSYMHMLLFNRNTFLTFDNPSQQRICFFVTKNKATEPANIDCIAESLVSFSEYIFPNDATIAVPELGYGDIDWIDVEQLLYQYLDAIPQKVYLCKNKDDRRKAIDAKKE